YSSLSGYSGLGSIRWRYLYRLPLLHSSAVCAARVHPYGSPCSFSHLLFHSSDDRLHTIGMAFHLRRNTRNLRAHFLISLALHQSAFSGLRSVHIWIQRFILLANVSRQSYRARAIPWALGFSSLR